ncbi:PPE family protein [Mycobacterium spongiae]|uniref:PPE domain-containing protein n=1 Tax=Mycobacterium spongiae TaxID=886343 RepID=A0A975JWL9_9MYCO|nr:PPE family protein [Mycobacterium spongiae]QUR67027.1 PPE domain-containing protein [Mycobacterium spongiae]
MDFGALPPEINSARMYAGAGAAPMLTAAAAWNDIAVELSTVASSFESVIVRLSTEGWMGPASLSMVAAAQPLLVWLSHTAESSALAAAQALASAAAFETAYATTVPPADVAANRELLAELTATNILGQNVSAIAATEARYGEMWAQDAAAMYGYAASSAVAGRLNPLARPSQVTNPAGLANQAAAVGQAAASGSAQQVALGNLISNLPDAALGLASPVAAAAQVPGLDTIIQDIDKMLGSLFVFNAFHGLGGIADYATASTSTAVFMMGGTDTVGHASGAAALGHTLPSAVIGGSRFSAALGTAPAVGRLTVPAGWSTAAPAMTAAAAVDGTSWAVPAEEGETIAMLGAPTAGAGVNGAGSGSGPRYGVKPTVMPRQFLV